MTMPRSIHIHPHRESRAAQTQGLRSNVRTLTSTVRTLLGPTPALIRLRAEVSQENRAILSKFERFWTSILAECCSQDVIDVF